VQVDAGEEQLVAGQGDVSQVLSEAKKLPTTNRPGLMSAALQLQR
jgi:hypothetical protein